MRRAINKSITNRSAHRGAAFSSLPGTSRTIATASAGAERLHLSGGALSQRWQTQNNIAAAPIAVPSILSPQSLRLQSKNNVLLTTSKFSTAAAMQEAVPEPAKKQQTRSKRKPMRKRNPLIITPTAGARIQFLLDQHNQTGGDMGNHAVGIRLGTKKRGCNGLSYTLNYAYDNHQQKHKRDEAMTINLGDPDLPGDGLMVYVEPMALMNIIGTTMDFMDDEMSSEFTFTNPNSKGECGCGESFNV